MSNIVMKQCKNCRKMTQHTQPSTSHLLHFFLSIFTMGIWLLVWLIMALNNGTAAQCTECGKTKGMFG